MNTRHHEFTGTRDVLAAHRFDTHAVAQYLARHLDGFQGPLTVSQFRGGQSNPTYLLHAASGDYVLRRKPPGKLLQSAHAIEREFRVISALYDAGFAVPRPFLLCEDEQVAGTAFFLMEFVDGRIFWDPGLPALGTTDRRRLYDELNRTIATLHTFDISALQLDDFGKSGNYVERQLSRWTRQYRASESASIDEMEQLIEWLPAHVPAQSATTMVHGDFRLDNIVCHPSEARIIAVLDWELSTLGDPLADFTYHLMAWQMPDIGIGSRGLQGVDIAALGIPDSDSYFGDYCRRTGRTASIGTLDFYMAYNFFRLAAIVQGIAGRVRDGTAASAHAENAAHAVTPLARLGWQHACRQGQAQPHSRPSG